MTSTVNPFSEDILIYGDAIKIIADRSVTGVVAGLHFIVELTGVTPSLDSASTFIHYYTGSGANTCTTNTILVGTPLET